MHRFILSGVLAMSLTASSTAIAESPVQGADYSSIRLTSASNGIVTPQQVKGPADSPEQARSMGAKWLIDVQREDGGWGAGEWGEDNLNARSDVATTAMTVLALLRDANGTPKHRSSIENGVRFVIKAIENGPSESAMLATPQGTQPQRKLGKLVDTHMAALTIGAQVCKYCCRRLFFQLGHICFGYLLQLGWKIVGILIHQGLGVFFVFRGTEYRCGPIRVVDVVIAIFGIISC